MLDVGLPNVHAERVEEKDTDNLFALAQNPMISRDVWHKCVSCKELLYWRTLNRNYKVCWRCGHHFRLRASERLHYILDEGSFCELSADVKTADPLKFVSNGETYSAKVSQTRKKTGLSEALVTGLGAVEGRPLALAVADFSFLGASMGSAFGEKLVRLIDRAVEQGLPLLTISCSGGARMHEGIFSLMQMPKTIAALGDMGRAGLPHISLLTDPCYGGVTASYASVADIILAEPGALIGFAGPRVIEQITQQKLPPGFQTAEFLLEHGMIDDLVPRHQLRKTVCSLLAFFSFCSQKRVCEHHLVDRLIGGKLQCIY